MLNSKNNENDAVFDEICKKKRNLNNISKNEGYFFGQHPLVENSPTATDICDVRLPIALYPFTLSPPLWTLCLQSAFTPPNL